MSTAKPLPRISRKRAREIANIRDEDIDFSDIPEQGAAFFRRAVPNREIAQSTLAQNPALAQKLKAAAGDTPRQRSDMRRGLGCTARGKAEGRHDHPEPPRAPAGETVE